MSWYPFDEDGGDERPGEDFDAKGIWRRGEASGEGFDADGLPRRDEAFGLPRQDADDAEPFESVSGRWPLDPGGLYPRERWLWFEQLWTDACMLRERYRLALRTGWWEDGVQVEALAALAAWVQRYDSGEWDDPPGKLALLYDLERVAVLLRDGRDPFSPSRDRGPFLHFLLESGCQPPAQGPPVG